MRTRRRCINRIVVGLAIVVLVGGCASPEKREAHIDRDDLEPLGRNEQGYPEYRHTGTGIVFVALPGGTFWMGSADDDEHARSDEKPRHSVRLRPFLISKYEVSQSQWLAVMGGNPSRREGADLPVETVSWFDCRQFCSETGLSLPTEAQWEYACRAGTSTNFAFGEALSFHSANFGWWEKAKAYEKTRPTVVQDGRTWFVLEDSPLSSTVVSVTSFPPNPFGLHQMHGNVFEWCRDVYDAEFYRKPESREVDPQSRDGSERRAVRGGSCMQSAERCRSGSRLWLDPSRANYELGFRAVIER